MKKRLHNTSTQRGATLLIAVLMTSLVLAVGLGVYERTYKSLLFSSYWRETQVAFAAADSGFECALYWDLHQGRLDSSEIAECFGQPWSFFATVNNEDGVNLPTLSGGCTNIRIDKTSVPGRTSIQARGYNDACGSENSRRVERALQITYSSID